MRGPERPVAASRLSCSSLGAGPCWVRPSSSAAEMYFGTVSLASPVPDAICRRLNPLCQRRMTSDISILDTSLYAIAAPHIEVRLWSLIRCPGWPIDPGELA